MSKRNRKRPGIGSPFDDFLTGEGTCESTQAVTIKRVLAWQIGQAMEENHISKAELTARTRCVSSARTGASLS